MNTLTAPADTALCGDCGTPVPDPETTPGGCDTGTLCDTDLTLHVLNCGACARAVTDAWDNR